jgi:Fe-S-cluster containining protein
MVRVTDAEIGALAKRLNVSESEFRKCYTRPFRKDITILLEKPNLDCIFYDREKGCTVYEDRPKQCRTWPFWDIIVLSPRTWQESAQSCPGMNKGPLHSAEEIERTSQDDGTCASAFALRTLASKA